MEKDKVLAENNAKMVLDVYGKRRTSEDEHMANPYGVTHLVVNPRDQGSEDNGRFGGRESSLLYKQWSGKNQDERKQAP